MAVIESVASSLSEDGTPKEPHLEKKVILEAANRVDTVEALFTGTGEAKEEASLPQKRHFVVDETTPALEGSDSSGQPQRRHFAPAETTEAEGKSSIKLVDEKPSDHGNLIETRDEPTDLSAAHTSKRVFPEKTSEEEPRTKVRKVVPDHANKKDHVFSSSPSQDDDADAAGNEERKHFDPPSDQVSGLLALGGGEDDAKDDDANVEEKVPAGCTSAAINELRDHSSHANSTAAAAKAKAMAGTSMANCLAWPEK
mmetsp:Transcript_1259/g.4250  ORF Transcript_1259/g.4250 Transcript_1259/m.4250 type:complete len:255 (-) Transcript_1259:116-880(-)